MKWRTPARALPLWRAGVGLLLILWQPGCQLASPLKVVVEHELSGAGTHLALLPVTVARIARGKRDEKVIRGAALQLTTYLRDALGDCPYLYLAPQEAVERAMPPSPVAGRGDPWEAARAVGIKLGLDAVVLGSLVVYSEREGGSWGARRPASVAFSVRVLRIPDGKELWRAEFQESQQPLSADLTSIGRFIRRGAKYITAGELAASGAEAAAGSLCRDVRSH